MLRKLKIVTLSILLIAFTVTFSQDTKQKISELITNILTDNDAVTAEKKIDELINNKDSYSVNREEIRAAAYQFLRQNQLDKGLIMLKANTKLHPESWEVYNTLGGILGWFEEYEDAVINLKKAQELNPENEEITFSLSRLNGSISDKKNETKETFNYNCAENTGKTGSYFNQKTPGLIPKLFAPGIISTAGNFEFSQTFTPDGKEFYFTRRADNNGFNVIMVSKWTEDGWTAPDTADFSKVGRNNEPHISADGKKMYFGTRRLKEGEKNPSYGIWMMERENNKWGSPIFAFNGMYVSTINDGSVYFTDIERDGEGGIHKSELKDGKFLKSVKLNGGVNNPGNGIHPFISPDEDYILFDCQRKDGYGGEGDLYVAFKDKAGNWGEAFNLGAEVNGPGTDFCASVSPDGKFIFYNKNRDIYWVSSEIIEKFRPKK